jgi:hypothetical protein
VFGLVPLAWGLSLFIKVGLSGPYLVAILITVPIGIAFLVIAACFPTMRYEVEGRDVTLTYGPLLRYIIHIKQIKSIRRRELGFSPVSGFRFRVSLSFVFRIQSSDW